MNVPPKTIRAKFTCMSAENDAAGTSLAQFSPVYTGSPENEAFFRATPGGGITLFTMKGDLFQKGVEYFVDFTPAS